MFSDWLYAKFPSIVDDSLAILRDGTDKISEPAAVCLPDSVGGKEGGWGAVNR